MRIGMQEINEAIYWVALQKLKKSLENEGFEVTSKKDMDPYCDLFAEKNDDKRMYILKIGKNKTQQRVLSKIQEVAKEKRAKLFVTYLEQPKTSKIEYDGLENMLFDYLINHMPDELDILSTHTALEDINDLEINSISIVGDKIKIEGSARIDVELKYGSTHDDIDEMNDSFEFVFRVNILKGKIDYAYFKFDLEHFYE